jgi:hypothetical protein
MDSQDEQDQYGARSVRQVARWAVLLGAAAWGVFAGGFLAYNSLGDRFIVELTRKQFGAMIWLRRQAGAAA